MNALLDTMSTETGERCAQAAQKTALETVIEDTEAELAKLQRSKVASMIALYQGSSCLPSPSAGPWTAGCPQASVTHSPPPLSKHGAGPVRGHRALHDWTDLCWRRGHDGHTAVQAWIARSAPAPRSARGTRRSPARSWRTPCSHPARPTTPSPRCARAS